MSNDPILGPFAAPETDTSPAVGMVISYAVAIAMMIAIPGSMALAQSTEPPVIGTPIEVELAVDPIKPSAVPNAAPRPRSQPSPIATEARPTPEVSPANAMTTGPVALQTATDPTAAPERLSQMSPTAAALETRPPRRGRDADGDPITEHRMQAPFPNHNVVVCLAGCPSGRETIVFFEPRRPTFEKPVRTAAVAAASTTDAGIIRVADTTGTSAPEPSRQPAASTGVACVAGCYSSPKTYTGKRGAAALDMAPSAPVGRVIEGTWLTAVSEPSTTVDASGRPSPVKRGLPAKAKRKPAASGSSDWFTKRF
jgi:hypothetical protein